MTKKVRKKTDPLQPRIIEHPDYAKALLDSVKEAVTVSACYRYTDKQLIMKINQSMIKRGLIIKEKTFVSWRNSYIEKEEWVMKNPIVFEVFALIERAILEAMDYLMDQLEISRSWQRYAWILERKFDQWQLKKEVEVTGEVNHNVQLVLNMPSDIPIITKEDQMEKLYNFTEYDEVKE